MTDEEEFLRWMLDDSAPTTPVVMEILGELAHHKPLYVPPCPEGYDFEI